MTLTPRQRHILIALVAGALAGSITYARVSSWGILAADLTWPWRGARALLAGQNPYQVIQPIGTYPFDAPLFYPLPALLMFVPFAAFPPELAAGLFMAMSVALLVFGLTRDGYARLPLLISLPFMNTLVWPQWSPLLTAAMLMPGLLPLALAKPSIGLVGFAARGSRRALLISAAILLLSLAILPTWPWDWLRAIREHGGVIPLRYWPAPLLLIALTRWRDWRARLVVGMAAVPQISYDVLPLWLVPTTFRQSLLLSFLSWCALLSWQPAADRWLIREPMIWMIIWVYLPACAMLFWPDVVSLGLWRRTKDERPRTKRLSE